MPAKLALWLTRLSFAAGLVALIETVTLVTISPLVRGDPVLFFSLWSGLWALLLLPFSVYALVFHVLGGLRLHFPTPALHRNLAFVAGLACASVAVLGLQRVSRGVGYEFTEPVLLTLGLFTVLALAVSGALVGMLTPLAERLSQREWRLLTSRRLLAAELLTLLIAWQWVLQIGIASVHERMGLLLGGLATPVPALCFAALVWSGPASRAPRAVLIGAGIVILLGAASLAWRADARFLLRSRAASGFVFLRGVDVLMDFDGDGTAAWFVGGSDCAPWDPGRSARQLEIPGDGIDQDCQGGDAVATSETRAGLPLSGPWARCLAGVVARPRAIFLITIDALRADALSPELTPAMVELASRSAWFTQAYSQSTSTFLSLYALLSGRQVSDFLDASPATRAGQQGEGSVWLDDVVAVPSQGVRQLELFPQRLRAAGYRTLAVTVLHEWPMLLEGIDEVTIGVRDPFYPPNGKWAYTSGALTDAAIALLEANRSNPTFYWLHYLDPHAPYLPRPRPGWRGNVHHSAYEMEVGYTVKQLERLLRAIQALPVDQQPVLLLTSDHGEDLAERGRHGHGPDLFSSSIHVPLALSVPGCPGTLVELEVGHSDVAPALCLLAGAPCPGSYSLLDAIAGIPRPVPLVVETGWQADMRRAVITPRHKLIVDVQATGRLLFDLQQDPGETISLYGRDDALRADMETRYQRWLDRPRSGTVAAVPGPGG